MCEEIDMGAPSNIIWWGKSMLGVTFHAFITLVTIRSLTHLTKMLNFYVRAYRE